MIDRVKLLVMNGVAAGREIPLPSTLFIIGRSSKCHLRPHSDLVSKVHCGITRKMGRVLVRDLQSRNGTYVNGELVSPTRPTYVNDGDVLTVGPMQFQFCIPEEGAAEVQMVSRREISWLMDNVEEFTMDSAYETQLLEVIDEPIEDEFHDTETATRENGLSAGAYMHEYLGRGQTSRPNPEEPEQKPGDQT